MSDLHAIWSILNAINGNLERIANALDPNVGGSVEVTVLESESTCDGFDLGPDQVVVIEKLVPVEMPPGLDAAYLDDDDDDDDWDDEWCQGCDHAIDDPCEVHG